MCRVMSLRPQLKIPTKHDEMSDSRNVAMGPQPCRRIGYLQFVNGDELASAESFTRFLGVMLRYPGLCRYNCW